MSTAKMSLGGWVALAACGAALCCERDAGAATPDRRYVISIAGDPARYEPGEHYAISLKGAERDSEQYAFSGFTLWVESEDQPLQTNSSRGGFQAYDSRSKPHPTCPSALVNATALPKTEIQAMWSAPSDGVGCVVLAALVWDGAPDAAGAALERRLCAAEPRTYVQQPPIVNPCCACDEAKYEVTFEGLWSRNTHPKDFPSDERITRYSDVIGASHTVHYRFWEVGRVASQGLRELAEEGHTTTLEKELKAESDNIRTIIKARGMSWPRLGGATFAVFRVDARRHLVSLVSRLSPSPDWVVGVSALELCRPNCTWLQSDTIDLYPYDAGTDSGVTYMSRRQRTVPPGPVRALRPDWPDDPRSPFHDLSGDAMKPFARMRLTRQRLYEKNCELQSPPPPGGAIMSPERERWGPCATGAWGVWSACSVTCGAGVAVRQRYYLEPGRAGAHACRRPLTARRRCRGPRMHCRAPSEYEPDPALTAHATCAVSTWSDWSACSSRDCRAGVRVRTRHYLHQGASKRCHTGWKTQPIMDQTLDCFKDEGNCTVEEENTSSESLTETDDPNDATTDDSWNSATLQPETDGGAGWEEVRCVVSPWGSWSACSTRCGRGWRMRTRFYVTPPPHPAHNLTALARTARLQRRLTEHLTQLWNRRFAAWQNVELEEVNITDSDPDLEARFHRQLEVCEFTLTMQDSECEGQHPNCPVKKHASEVCGLPLAVGACRGYETRWFFDAQRGNCEPFGYSGCRGNVNNFKSHHECLQLCANYTGGPISQRSEDSQNHLSENTERDRQRSRNWLNHHGNPAPLTSAISAWRGGRAAVSPGDGRPADCVVSPWSGWSTCAGDCRAAIKLNYRHVLKAPENGGRRCPAALLHSRHCRPAHCRRPHNTT